MRILHYIEIENFKGFGARQRIELDHPSVLIGPNNCGKTTVLQAIALWSQAVKAIFEASRKFGWASSQHVDLTRLELFAVPVERLSDLSPDEDALNFGFSISVGIWGGVDVVEIPVQFDFEGAEVLRITLATTDPTFVHGEAFAAAARTNVHLLYSMSGLQLNEPILAPGYVDVLMGQGRTSEVLRNLCLMVYASEPADWQRVVDVMARLFGLKLNKPVPTAQGTIALTYEDADETLALGMAGRGFLQVLLILAYLYSRRGAVLLIDEPDAHLEILRQKQIYVLLQEIAAETGGQVIIATHSPEIIDAAIDRNLTLLVGGHVEALATQTDIRHALKHYGANHYVRARSVGHVLYVEGSTDIAILRALAQRLEHVVAAEWDERANVYFVENNYPDSVGDFEQALERIEGGFGLKPKDHFFALRSMLPGLRGVGLFDNDGRDRKDSDEGGLHVVYWRRYEAENYFVTPELLASYARQQLLGSPQASQVELSSTSVEQALSSVIDQLIRERLYADDASGFATFKQTVDAVREQLWKALTVRVKLSDFAEEFFRRLAIATQTPMLLSKGELHRMIDLVDPASIDPEVIAKLDLLQALWRPAAVPADAG